MMKALVSGTWFLALAALLLVCLPSTAWPCSCVPPPPPAEASEQTDVVFLGRVLAVRPGDTWLGYAGILARQLWSNGRDPYIRKWEASPRALKAVELEVQEGYKGVSTETVTVYTANGGADCGQDFRQRRRYLVYGYMKDDPLTPGSRFVVTSECTRTAHRERDDDEVNELRRRSHASGVTGRLNRPPEGGAVPRER